MQLGCHRLEEDAEALAHAQTDGENEEAAPHGSPVGAGGHGAESEARAWCMQALPRHSAIELLHAVTSSYVAERNDGAIGPGHRVGAPVPDAGPLQRACRRAGASARSRALRVPPAARRQD